MTVIKDEKYSSPIVRMDEEKKKQMIKEHSPHSPVLKNSVFAFLIGGLICSLGEVIRQVLILLSVDADTAKALASLSLILLGALATALGIFDRIARRGGAGTMLPITGFSNSIVSEALDSQSEGKVLGIGAKIFTVAGPVILYGLVSGVIFGIFYYIAGFIGK